MYTVQEEQAIKRILRVVFTAALAAAALVPVAFLIISL